MTTRDPYAHLQAKYDKLEEEYKDLESMTSHIIGQYNQLMKDSLENMKKLEALEILKNKGVNVYLLLRCSSAEKYNKGIMDEERHLNKEEFELLKEVLG